MCDDSSSDDDLLTSAFSTGKTAKVAIAQPSKKRKNELSFADLLREQDEADKRRATYAAEAKAKEVHNGNMSRDTCRSWRVIHVCRPSAGGEQRRREPGARERRRRRR